MTSSVPPEPDPTGDPAAPAVPDVTDDAGEVWGSIWSEAIRAAFATPPPPIDPDVP